MIDHSAVFPVLDLDASALPPHAGLLAPMAADQRQAQIVALAESLSFSNGS